MDARMHRVLKRLENQDSPKLASALFNINEAPPGVVSGTLVNARKLGLCERVDTNKKSMKFWIITDAGRAALKEPA